MFIPLSQEHEAVHGSDIQVEAVSQYLFSKCTLAFDADYTLLRLKGE